MNEQNQRPVPNWLIFIFCGVLISGGLQFIYKHVFLKINNIEEYMRKNQISYVTPTLAIIPDRNLANIKEGSKIYSQVCVACHGIYGDANNGLLGPNLADDIWLHSSEEEKINLLINKGVSQANSLTGNVMPARAGGNLNSENIWKIVYFLSSKNKSIIQKEKKNK